MLARGASGDAEGISEVVNPLGLYLGAAALNNVRATSEMGRKASPAAGRSKGTWEVGEELQVNERSEWERGA